MASPPVTFPCPFCTRRMGVPAELLGRQVRCPHCKQVVVAPTSVGPSAVPEPGPVPAPQPAPDPVAVTLEPVSQRPTPPAPEPELRPFNIPQKKEGADSILSEPNESDDEVFGGSHPGQRLRTLPPLEPEPPAPAPAPAPPANPFSFAATVQPLPQAPVGGPVAPPFLTGTVFPLPNVPEPATDPVPAPAAAPEAIDSFEDLAPEPLPPAAPPIPQPVVKPVVAVPAPQPTPLPVPAPLPQPVAAKTRPVAAPLPAPVPAPTPIPAGDNPFAAFDEAPAPVKASRPMSEDAGEVEEAPRKKKKKRPDDEEPEEQPTRAARTAAPGSGGIAKTVLIVLLAGYGFVATLVAIYGLFFSSGTPAGHPLSTIPDNFGEYDPVSRKKVSKANFPVDGPLPPEQRANLGGKITIGQIEVQPVRIEKRGLEIKVEGTSDKEKEKTLRPGKALVLTLDIKNASPDLPIFPVDPAFNRRETKNDQPITRLVVGKRTFFGGEIEWPLPALFKKKSEVQQGNDAIALKPGESREYVIFTAASTDLIKTAEAEKGQLQWRVQLRRGLIDYRGKEVPVTAVIGIDFKASDIREPG